MHMYLTKLAKPQRAWFEKNIKGFSKYVDYSVEEILVSHDKENVIEFIIIGSVRQIIKVVINRSGAGPVMWYRLTKRDTLLCRLEADNPVLDLPETIFNNLKKLFESASLENEEFYYDLEKNMEKNMFDV